MSKQFLGMIIAVIVVFVGIFALTSNKSDTSTKNSNGAQPTQHVLGKNSTGVTLVEYGDYQCPYCQQYYPTVKQVAAKFSDQIQFQFRNFPLVSLHQNAFAAARAAEAAGQQNKFWEMHDALYETPNWQVWTNSSSPSSLFNQYAQQLGLDTEKFKSDYSSSKINDLINADSAAGNKLGITGTPTFYLNGKQIQINNDVASFEKVIKAEIAKKPQTSDTTNKQ